MKYGTKKNEQTYVIQADIISNQTRTIIGEAFLNKEPWVVVKLVVVFVAIFSVKSKVEENLKNVG
jgi:hypothetical protein